MDTNLHLLPPPLLALSTRTGGDHICAWCAVRVINCDGSAQSSSVIAGLDWLAQNFQLPAVASMSLGSDSPNQALDDAVTAIIGLGITAVIAAGNYNQGRYRQDLSSLP